MTARDCDERESDAVLPGSTVAAVLVRHIERTCSTVIDGRRAARALAQWLRRFELGEAEFQLLWRLRDVPAEGLDQRTLAAMLAISPAQVSATVERSRSRGWIAPVPVRGDRRRNLWQLSAGGRHLLEQMLSAAAELRYESAERGGITEPLREAAA